MHSLLIHNKKRLSKYIEKYEGQIVHGILVTESGLLAAAHLGGQGSVKKWFRTGKVRKDGNGVKITNYMQRFGGYNLNLDIYIPSNQRQVDKTVEIILKKIKNE